MTSSRNELLQLLTRPPSQPVTRIPKVPDGAQIPLIPSQARIWFFSQLYPDSTEYNMFHTVGLDSVPEEARLVAALRTLISRHDALRLRISQQNGIPVQQDTGPYDPEVAWYDLSDISEGEAEARAMKIANAAARMKLRPEEPPLVRFAAVKLPHGKAMIIIGFHHVIADYWSWSLLREELISLLAGRALGPPCQIRFIDYAAWLRSSDDETRRARDRAYWSAKLAGPLPILDLPMDRPRPSVPSRRGFTVPIVFAPAVLDRVQSLAEQENTTPYVITLAAYKAMLGRLSGQHDLVVGTAFAGRDHPFAERLFGCFVKSMALRTDLGGAASFREVVRRTRETVLEAQDHQYLPYEQIVAELAVPRDLSVHPVFQAQFTLVEAESVRPEKGQEERVGQIDYGSAKWDLTLVLTRAPDGLSGILEGSADTFDQATLERFGAIYAQLLDVLTATPDRTLAEHPLVPAQERDRILYELNPYERPEHPYRTLAEPFEEQVARTPRATALVGDEGTLSYAELNARANRLAHHLRSLGAGPGTRVALCLERSLAMIAAVYAVAKTGATYVPLDPELPDGRLAFMLEDTAPLAVIADNAACGRLPTGNWRVVAADNPAVWADQPGCNPTWRVPSGQSSQLLYTSGSTGRPKAVASAVDGSIADIQWLQRRYPYRFGNTALCKTSYGFDASLWEIFWPLYTGARLVVCRPGGHRDVRYLADMVERYNVTTIYLIAGQLQVFLDELPDGRCGSLRWIISGGEPVTARLRDTCHKKLGAELVHAYGPTEGGRVTDMIVARHTGSPVVPVGNPSPNFRIYVLDENLEVMPVGITGEAYIAAEVGLSHGYHRRPELTAERFLPDPYGPAGGRMYRTGDLCRYRDDGTLEHLGRLDSQVKIRGMRIELAEVEAVISEHPAVAEAVALAMRVNGEQDIAAFAIPASASVTADELRQHATRMLPQAMVPTTIQIIERLPLNVNGKTDLAALRARWQGRTARPGGEIVRPRDKLERAVADIFGRLFGESTELSATDSFFELGGHSLLVFKLIAACEAEFGTRLEVADVFSRPTIRELADRLRSSTERASASLVPLAPAKGLPLLVLIHAAGGSVLPFQEVAGRLADRFSVFALQAPDDDAAASIAELAARYVPEVDRVRGLGPVCLAGWSMGGCIALEMAREWRQRGVDVAATVMLDTWVPPALFEVDEERAMQRRAIEDLDMAPAGYAEPIARGALAAQMSRVTERNRLAMRDYWPVPFAGQVYYLRASEQLALTTTRPVGDGSKWGRAITDLIMRDIPGNHYTLLAAEHVQDLAETLTAIAEDALCHGEI